MENLKLKRLWEVCNKLSSASIVLEDEDEIYISLLGNSSNYTPSSFESFLDYYSFSVQDDKIIVFNDDGVPFEDYRTDDYSYIDVSLLELSDEALDGWIKEEVDRQIAQQKLDEEAEQKRIKLEIERLQKRLK